MRKNNIKEWGEEDYVNGEEWVYNHFFING